MLLKGVINKPIVGGWCHNSSLEAAECSRSKVCKLRVQSCALEQQFRFCNCKYEQNSFSFSSLSFFYRFLNKYFLLPAAREFAKTELCPVSGADSKFLKPQVANLQLKNRETVSSRHYKVDFVAKKNYHHKTHVVAATDTQFV